MTAAKTTVRTLVKGAFRTAFALLFLAGCAGQQSQLSRSLHLDDVKRSLGLTSYYVKSRTTLRSAPDHASRTEGVLATNTEVKELSKTDNGWSKVKTVPEGREGWIPTSRLAGQPTKTAVSVKKKPARTSPSSEAAAEAKEESQEKPESAQVESASAQPQAASETAASEEGGSLLSPAPAAAATLPPSTPQKQPPQKPAKKEGAQPDMFDAF